MEMWGISMAFLVGLNYEVLRRYGTVMGVEGRGHGKVYFELSVNVWRRLRDYPKSKIRIVEAFAPCL
eukprot:662401-Lingulodinium_polyedra.AAC.1